MHPTVDFSLNIWTVGSQLLGAIGAGVVAAWKLGQWTQAMKALSGQFQAHEAADEKRFEETREDIRETRQRIDAALATHRR